MDTDTHTDGSTASGDPYLLLNVPRTASSKEIRKAYYLLARKVHPDRNKAPDAAISFQTLGKAYAILSDPDKRGLFDRTGCTDQDSEAFWEAYQHYRTVYPEVTKEDVEGFANNYRHSEEEKTHLLEFYRQQKGDLTRVMAHIMCSVSEDAPRFVAFYESEINKGTLQRTERFDQTRNTCGNMDWLEEEDKEGDNVEEEEEEEVEEEGEEDEMNGFIVPDCDTIEMESEEDQDQEVEAAEAEADISTKSNKRKNRNKSADKSPGVPVQENAKKKSKQSKKGGKGGKGRKGRKGGKGGKGGQGGTRKRKSGSSSGSGGGSDMDALRAMMMQRGKQRNDDMVRQMEKKYGGR